MGAICDYCKQDMEVADGCTYTHLSIEGKVYQRDRSHWCKPEGRCHDCGAKYGQLHHWGCDEERCPVCGGQAIGCECLGGGTLLKKKAKGGKGGKQL